MIFQLIDKVYTGNANKAGYLCMGYNEGSNERVFLCYPHDDVMRLVKNCQVMGVTSVGDRFESVRGFTKPRGLTAVGNGIDLAIIKEFIRYKDGLLPLSICSIAKDVKSDDILVSFRVETGKGSERPNHPVIKALGKDRYKRLTSGEFVKLVALGCCSIAVENNCIMTANLPDHLKSFKREFITFLKKYGSDVDTIHPEVKTYPYGKTISPNVIYCIDKDAINIGAANVINKRISRRMQ